MNDYLIASEVLHLVLLQHKPTFANLQATRLQFQEIIKQLGDTQAIVMLNKADVILIKLEHDIKEIIYPQPHTIRGLTTNIIAQTHSSLMPIIAEINSAQSAVQAGFLARILVFKDRSKHEMLQQLRHAGFLLEGIKLQLNSMQRLLATGHAQHPINQR